MRRRLTLLAVALVLLPGAAAWEQYRGGPDRGALARLPSGPLDVIGNFSFGEGVEVGSFSALPAVETAHGLLVLVRHPSACVLSLFADLAQRPAETATVEDCTGETGAALLGYDAASDSLLVCVPGPASSPVLRAVDPLTGKARWGLAPADALALAESEKRGAWRCTGAALDPATGEVVLAFWSASGAERHHRIASLDLATGEPRWVTYIPEAFPTTTLGLLPAPSTFVPRSVTLTTTGVVVVSNAVCPTCLGYLGNEGALSWFTREGSFRGGLRAVTGNPADPASGATPRPVTSNYAVASGPLAAAAVGSELVLVNPEVGDPVARAPIRSIEPGTAYIFWPVGVWTGDEIVLMLPHSLTAFDENDLTPRWSWSEGLDWDVKELLVTAGGEVVVLAGRSGGESVLVHLDARTGEVRSRLPLGLVPEGTPDDVWPVGLVPLEGEGILVSDRAGRAVTVGSAPAALRPPVLLSDAYPGVGEHVGLDLAAPGPGDPERYVVNWGDGAIEEHAPGVLPQHAYADAGRKTVRVTAVYPRGLTATGEGTVDVGGTPPEPKTLLQTAFSPEYENLTFGLLGLALTLLGGAVTFGRARRRRSRLERELATLDRIRAVGEKDPEAAARALVAYREGLPVALGRGRIDDGQYGVLELRALRLLKLLRTRVVAPVETRLSPRFARLVDSAFEDGILHAAECRNLLAALAVEARLEPGEREAIAAFLRACVHEGQGEAPLSQAGMA